jgi:hypothetical protein
MSFDASTTGTNIMTYLGFAAHRRAASVWAARLAAALACVATPALAASDQPANLSPDQLAQVQQLCQTNLHLRPGETHFEGCVAGLSDALADASRTDAVLSAREACFNTHSPGTSDLVECLLTASDGPSTAISSKSYFRASPDDIARGEKLSCAKLGFDPISGAFEGCVADLAGALDAVDRAPDQ